MSDRLLAESNSAARLFSWGNLLRYVLPRKPSAQYVTVYETAVDVLNRALGLAQQADRPLAERIEYTLDCALRDLALATDQTESIDEREDRIMRWRDFIGRDWAGPRFYADLFDEAREVAHELTFSRVPDRDSDSLYWAYLIAGVAYQYLWATHSESYIAGRMNYTGNLLNRAIRYALPTRRADVWKEIWHVAESLHTFPSPGIEYAQSLLQMSGGQSSKDEAITVLLKVSDIFNLDPNELRFLAETASTRTDLAPSLKTSISDLISDHISRSTGATSLALLYSAAALLEEDESLRRRHLEESAEWFSKVRWNSTNWQDQGHYWGWACAELKRLGGSAAGCGSVFQNVRTKMERAKR